MGAQRVIEVKLLVTSPGAAQAAAQASGALDKTAASFDNMGKAAKETGTATQAGLGAAAAAAKSSSATIGSSFKGGFAQAVSGAGLAANAGAAAGLAIAGSAVLAAGAVLKIGLSYEQSMNTFQAVTRASASEMQAVGAEAKALGNDLKLPGVSAADAAEAMTELAKGNLTAAEAMTAARGTLQLATAAQISGAQAATIQADALNGFNLEADQAGHVADVLANAANSATGEIGDFAQGLSQSSAVAHLMGVNLDDTTTVLGLFANAGVKGSDAGTSLKTMFTQLQSPTDVAKKAIGELGLTVYDSQGNFVGMRTIVEQLSKAHATLTSEEFNSAAGIVFGNDAIRGAGIVAEGGVAAYDKMAESIGRVGGAAELSAAQAQGVTGAWGALTSTLETGATNAFLALQPAIEGALHFVTDMVTGIGDLIGWVTSLPGPVLAIATAFGAVALLSGPLNAMWAGIKSGAETAALTMLVAKDSAVGMGGGMAIAKAGVLGLGTALKTAFLSNPIGIAIIGITTALSLFSGGSDDAAAAATDLTGVIDTQTGAFVANAQAVAAKALADSGSLQAAAAIGVSAETYTRAVLGEADAIEQVNAAIAAGVFESYNTELGYTTTQTDAAAAAAEHFAADTGGLNDKLQKAQLALEGAATGTTDVGTAAVGASAGLGGFAEKFTAMGAAMSGTATASAEAEAPISAVEAALTAASDAASAADDSLQFFNLTVQAMLGINTSAEQATKLLNDSIRATQAAFADANTATEGQAKALIDVSGGIDTTTKAGSDLYDGLQDIVKGYGTATTSAYDQAVAAGNVTGALGLARTAADNARAKFIEQATAAGLSADQAGVLATKLGIVEGVKLTDKNFAVSVTNLEATYSNLSALQRLQIADKFFHVRPIVDAGGFGGQFNRLLGQADGGIFQSGVQKFANGGFAAATAAGGLLRRDPMIAAAGRMILWAEPETGGESYIPHASSKRQRSEMLMAKTAEIFDGHYTPSWQMPKGIQQFANGGFAGMGGSASSAAINPKFNVQVYVGNREITDIVDLRVSNGVDGAFRSLADNLTRAKGQTQ